MVGEAALGNESGLLAFVHDEDSEVARLAILRAQVESAERMEEEVLLEEEVEVLAFDLVSLRHRQADESTGVDCCEGEVGFDRTEDVGDVGDGVGTQEVGDRRDGAAALFRRLLGEVPEILQFLLCGRRVEGGEAREDGVEVDTKA